MWTLVQPGNAHRRLAVAGILGIGVAFGFARYGYGLFLPQIREAFGLSLSWIGAIASASYAGYLAALVLVGVLVGRLGPRIPVVIGGLSAAVGMGLVAMAQEAITLTVGLVLAGTSAGWVWAPYSDAADRMLTPRRRQTVLALLPTGTAFATVVAGVLALLVSDGPWRWVWVLFALTGLGAAAYNAWVLPGGAGRGDAGVQGIGGAKWLMTRAAVPLYVTAWSYGLVGSVYWAFAVDAVSGGSGGDSATGALFWTLMGAAGVVAVFTGGLITKLGVRGAHTLLFCGFAMAVALLGVLPGLTVAVVVSAVIYGAVFMAISGLLAVWSLQVFPERPSAGFSAVVFSLGLGTVVGPAVLGALADHAGLGAAFLSAAGIAVVTLIARPA